jgi:predicted nuclease of predicted toxin-antitoxin system
VRFFLDHDVSTAVARSLRAAGHEAWSAENAALDQAVDDDLSVYAHDHKAILVTHDREFSRRRRQNVVGWHVLIRGHEWEAAALLGSHLDTIESLTNGHADVFFEISERGCELSFGWD